jgi:hypothetical protein
VASAPPGLVAVEAAAAHLPLDRRLLLMSAVMAVMAQRHLFPVLLLLTLAVVVVQREEQRVLAARAAAETATKTIRALAVAEQQILAAALARELLLEAVVPVSSSFVTPIRLHLLNLRLDRRQSPHLAAIAFTVGLALVRLRFKESSWRTLHNLMRTMSSRK